MPEPGTQVDRSSGEAAPLLPLRWNDTVRPYAQHRCIHELFEEQAALGPQSTAVVDELGSLTYAELNARANKLARYLRSLGVGPDRCVAICLERSVGMVVGLLGILKAGGAYVPLDPSYPGGRLAQMLADSQPMAVLTHGPARARFAQASGALVRLPCILDIDTDVRLWDQESDLNLSPTDLRLTSSNLVYVIYTSGSTGTPKGVMTEHRALVNRVCWMQSAYSLDNSDTVLQKTPFSFDVSVWEFLWTLTSGARLVMARPEGHKDPLYLSRVIQHHRVTTLHFVPSMLRLFLCAPTAHNCHSLKHVICSGEVLPASLLERFQAVLPDARLHNLYGPTEAAIDVTSWTWDGQALAENQSPPIGRPIWNTRIYILDGEGQPVPVGAPGEIHIGGVGVARGYLNRPELTRERFIPSPFVRGERLYKTGDLGQYLPNGDIEFLGRNDQQVKINGLRIELGDIESQLLRCPGVREAVVLAREDNLGNKRLVAYYSLLEGSQVSVADLNSHLATTLPYPMTPAAYVRLNDLPLTSNGKLDRGALPIPDAGAYDRRDSARRMNPTQSPNAGECEHGE